MTNDEMITMADAIAKNDPDILLKALRENGFWMYAVSKEAMDDYIRESSNADLIPVTDDDMNYVNYYDRVADVVNYEDVMNELVMQIRNNRITKDNSR